MRTKVAAIEQTRATLEGLGSVDPALLAAERVTAAAIERLLSRLVDLAVDVNSHVAAAKLRRAPGEYRESFDLAVRAGLIDQALADELRPSVGLRNIIVHEYVHLDFDLVAAAAPQAVEAYGRYVEAVAAAVAAP